MMIIIHNVHLTRICTDYNFVDLQRKMAYCEKGKRGYKTSDNKGKKLFVQDRVTEIKQLKLQLGQPRKILATSASDFCPSASEILSAIVAL